MQEKADVGSGKVCHPRFMHSLGGIFDWHLYRGLGIETAKGTSSIGKNDMFYSMFPRFLRFVPQHAERSAPLCSEISSRQEDKLRGSMTSL